MKLNLSNKIDLTKFNVYCETLSRKGCLVELKEIKPVRSNQQNRYFHLIINWFAIEYGERAEWVKQELIKKELCPEIFRTEYANTKNGVVREDWRSTSDLDSGELTKVIDKFRTWSGMNGIYLPSPDEEEFLRHIQIEIERNYEYL